VCFGCGCQTTSGDGGDVLDLREEAHFRRVHRVLFWQEELELENAACESALGQAEWAICLEVEAAGEYGRMAKLILRGPA
jgi:hypothetical protein